MSNDMIKYRVTQDHYDRDNRYWERGQIAILPDTLLVDETLFEPLNEGGAPEVVRIATASWKQKKQGVHHRQKKAS